MREKSRPFAFQCSMPFFVSSRSARPIRSLNLRMPSLRHQLARFFGDEEEVIDDVLGLAGELLAQHRILRGHADRAGVEMALAHHDAALRPPAARWRSRIRRRRAARRSTTSRPVFIWPSTCTAMRPRRRFSTSVCCVSARPSSHGVPACLIDDQGDRAGAAVVAGDRHVVGLGLGHARGHRADADFGHQLDADRRRWDWRSSGRGSAAPGPRSNRCRGAAAAKSARRPASSSAARRCIRTPCWPGSWPPSPGFAPCAILIWICSALARYSAVTPKRPEATCLILDFSESPSLSAMSLSMRSCAEPRRQRLAGLDRRVAVAVFAALAGVRLAADAVHRDGERGVRLGRDRAQRHGAGGEALDDFRGRLDFLDRHRRAPVEAELEQAAQRHVPLRLVVDDAARIPCRSA